MEHADANRPRASREILLHAAEEWRTTLDALRDAVCLIDADGHILRCNRAMQQLLDRPFDRITGRSCWDLVYHRRTPPEAFAPPPDRRWKQGRSAFTKQFGNRVYEVSLDPIIDNGHVIGAVHVMAEVTDVRRLAQRMTEAEEAQRRRMARELHDRIGQTLTAIGINLTYLRELLHEQPPPVLARLDESIEELEQVSAGIRDVMAELRPLVLDDYGLGAALQWYARQFSRRTGIRADVRDASNGNRLPRDIETALFRIAQEAFTNISKHAQAKSVSVTLHAGESACTLRISDDGVGFDSYGLPPRAGRAGWGILTMTERAEAIGGRLRLESRPGDGATILVEIPFPSTPAPAPAARAAPPARPARRARKRKG